MHRDREINIKLERIDIMQKTIIMLNERLEEHGPQVLTEDEICEAIDILLEIDDEISDVDLGNTRNNETNGKSQERAVQNDVDVNNSVAADDSSVASENRDPNLNFVENVPNNCLEMEMGDSHSPVDDSLINTGQDLTVQSVGNANNSAAADHSSVASENHDPNMNLVGNVAKKTRNNSRIAKSAISKISAMNIEKRANSKSESRTVYDSQGKRYLYCFAKKNKC